jgi:hypothetical protein
MVMNLMIPRRVGKFLSTAEEGFYSMELVNRI